MNKETLLNILLLPKKLYQNLNGNRFTLYIGILLVGVIDTGFYLSDKYRELFLDKPQSIFMENVLLACIFSLLIGIIDVLFFSKPLFDLFKRFVREEGPTAGRDRFIPLMKVYVVANIYNIPLQLFFLYLIRKTSDSPQGSMALLVLIVDLMISMWFNAIITRGINSIYRFHPLFKRLVFPVVFLWSFLLSYAMSMLYTWASMLFR